MIEDGMRDDSGRVIQTHIGRDYRAEVHAWPALALGEIFQEVNTRVRDADLAQEEIPILSITRDRGLVFQNKKFKHRVASSDISNYKLVHKGELVYGFPINEGVIAILLCSEHGAVSPAYHVWKPKLVINQEFFNWLLRMPSAIDAFTRLASTTVQRRQNLPPDGFRSVVVSFPAFAEQKRIASVLLIVQQAKEACERVIAATRQLKQSFLQYLFTYGPVPFNQADKVPLKEREIGTIPESWKMVRLKAVIQKTSQANPAKRAAERFMYIDVSGVSSQKLQIINYTEYLGVEAPSRARKLVKAGDVIWATVRPSLKRIAVVPPELDGQICSTAFCVLRANPEILNPTFLFYATTTDTFVNRLKELQRGASYPAVTDNNVRDECIPLPSLPEQHIIAERLSTVDAKLAAEEARRDALANLFQSLLHHLMTGKVRVTE